MVLMKNNVIALQDIAALFARFFMLKKIICVICDMLVVGWEGGLVLAKNSSFYAVFLCCVDCIQLKI